MSTASMRPGAASRSGSGPRPASAEVTVVTSPACHLCEDALEELAQHADAVTVRVVPADTRAGRDLVQRHRPVMFPLVLVDDAFLSSGRLPRRKLDQVLAARARGAVSS